MVKSELTDEKNITDKKGFVHRCTIEHFPSLGISIAYYRSSSIARREYGRMLSPTSDDDREWEEWEERFRESYGDIIADLEYDMKQHFDEQY